MKKKKQYWLINIKPSGTVLPHHVLTNSSISDWLGMEVASGRDPVILWSHQLTKEEYKYLEEKYTIQAYKAGQ